MPKHAVYPISPADCSGHRAALLLKGEGNRADAFENLLHVPSAFIGRGSLSRGSLLLRVAKAGQRRAYVRVEKIA